MMYKYGDGVRQNYSASYLGRQFSLLGAGLKELITPTRKLIPEAVYEFVSRSAAQHTNKFTIIKFRGNLDKKT